MVVLENVSAILIGDLFSVDRYPGKITLPESVSGEHHTIRAAQPQPFYAIRLLVVSDRYLRVWKANFRTNELTRINGRHGRLPDAPPDPLCPIKVLPLTV